MTSRNLLKIAIVVVLAAIVAALYFSPAREYLTRDNIRSTVAQLRGLWWGPIAFIAAYAIACVFGMPATAFILPAGVIWGWKFGGLYAVIGGMLGASAAYFVGRFLGEGVLERFGKVGRAVAKQGDHAGFRSILVLRLIPGIPFPVLNYGLGVARVRFVDFFFGTLCGVTPPTLVFAYSADALFNGTLTEGEALKRLVIVAALLIAMVLLPTLVKKASERRLPAGRSAGIPAGATHEEE